MFNDLRPALLPVALAGTATLLAVEAARERRRAAADNPAPNAFPFPGEAAGRKPRAPAVFATILAVYLLLLTGWIVPAHPLTGDEPHYLIITESLLSDGDIDLSDEYGNRDYLKFYPGDLETHAFPGRRGSTHLYSRHLPGLSVFLAPFYWLGEKAGPFAARVAGRPGLERGVLVFGARSGMCVLAALLVTAFYLLVLGVTGRRGASLAATGLFALTPPLAFYAHLVYPEIPVALVLLLIYDRLIRRRASSPAAFVLAGAGLGILPFFGIKYVVLSVAAFIAVVAARRCDFRDSLARTAAFLAPAAVAAGAFLLMLWTMYASLAPVSVYVGAERAKEFAPLAFLNVTPGEFATRFLGQFLDQRMGLLPYAPLLFLAFPGFVFFKRRAGRQPAALAAALFGSFWVFTALAPYWGGYCPPGRPLLPVVWIPALFMASALADAAVRRPLLTAGLLAATLLIVADTARRPDYLYHENLAFPAGGGEPSANGTSSQLLGAWSNSFADFRPLVPSLSNENGGDWRPVPFWVLAGVLIAVAYSRKSRPPDLLAGHGPGVLAPVVVWIFCALALGYAFFDVHIRDGFPSATGEVIVYPQDENVFPPELGGNWTKGRRPAVLLVASPRAVPLLRLTVTSPAGGRAFLSAGGASRTVEMAGREGRAEAIYPSPPGFRFRGKFYYRIRVRAEREFVPARLDRKSVDGRRLGVFLAVAADQAAA